MSKVVMNKDILNIIHAVLDYKQYLVSYHIHVLNEQNYDCIPLVREFYFSLPLPEGINKNTSDFENILRYSYNPKWLDELDNVQENELCNYNYRNF